MRCPFCGTLDTQVKDSRQSEDGRSIKRRRYCINCHSRFTTFERIELRELTVIKKDGARRPFDREKILRAISLAVRKRPITTEQIDFLIDNLIQKMEKNGESEIPSNFIGEQIMLELAKLDQVAYVRFASVYHDFTEAKDFENFLSKLRNSKD
jgi:transcriptional repressor NrdR